ncbi:MAG: hypothetical protein JWM31_3716, partial [Solirubrobacterales bacterium]|nr:hypothetical protein [Solirubrobacterales bacterium]
TGTGTAGTGEAVGKAGSAGSALPGATGTPDQASGEESVYQPGTTPAP